MFKLNMMNFIDYADNFETIINKNITTVDVKSDNEVRLICFDEIDKWNKLRKPGLIKSKLSIIKKPMTTAEIKEYLQELDNEFYKSLQRLIDGELIPNVTRLIIMFFTNNGQSIWDNLPDDLQSVKHRFTNFDFGYCDKKDVVSYLVMMYKKLNIIIDEKLYDEIPESISISYRKLKMIIILCSYEITDIISKLKVYINDDFQFPKTCLADIDIEKISSKSFEDYDYLQPPDIDLFKNFDNIDNAFVYYQNKNQTISNRYTSEDYDADKLLKKIGNELYHKVIDGVKFNKVKIHDDTDENILAIYLYSDRTLIQKIQIQNNNLRVIEKWNTKDIKIKCVIYHMNNLTRDEYYWTAEGKKSSKIGKNNDDEYEGRHVIYDDNEKITTDEVIIKKLIDKLIDKSS